MRGRLTTQAPSILPFFPAGFPDETIASRISRYCIRRGQPSTRSIYNELFQMSPFTLTFLVQPHLDKLAMKLPGSAKQNFQKLHQESTLLPLFQRFAGTQFTIANNAQTDEIFFTELPRRVVGDTALTHVCAQCLIDDERMHGSPYMHRAHQIPGVTTCWKHATRLFERCPSCRCPFTQPQQLILSAWLGCECGYSTGDLALTLQDAPTQVEIEFARFANVLLNGEQIQLANTQIVSLYKQRASELGLGWGNSRINRKALFAQIENYFGASLLSKMDTAYRTGKTSGWFHVFERSASVETPLNRHLIVSYYMFREAEIFLSSAKRAAETPVLDCARHGDADNESILLHRPGLVTTTMKQPAVDLLDELAETAERYGYDVQQLWKRYFGSMKRLVKLLPGACKVIEDRLLNAAAKKKQESIKSLVTKDRDHQIDLKWSDAIILASTELYQLDQKPTRVTMNQLIKAAKFRPKGAKWPTESAFPLTRAAVNAHAETTWHFYARRILWVLQSLHDPRTPDHKIIHLAGLEIYKGKAVLRFFSDVVRSGGTSSGNIATALEERSIGVDWLGPCPDQSFYSAGRAYRLRTSRRGKIGDKAGDRSLTPPIANI